MKYKNIPTKEEIIEVYINQNKSVSDCVDLFGYHLRSFQRLLKKYDIKKDRKLVYQLQSQTLQKTKGVNNVFQLSEVKEKSKQTSIAKYGKEHYVQTDEYKIKNQTTRNQQYGNDPYQREKYKQTCIEKYGVDNTNYIHFSNEHLQFVNSKDYTLQFIKDNNIQSALEFSNKTGIKLYASLTLLHKFDLMNMFQRYTSQEEKELQEFLSSLNIEYITHYKLSNKQEIDIYIPSLKLGIEYNGDYWHCDLFRDSNYHYNKSMYAQTEGIFIYHIFGYEWYSYKDKIKAQLLNLLQKNLTKIYARKCIIKDINNDDKEAFLNTNHLQGDSKSSINLGLYHNDELVSIMTFNNLDSNNYELTGFCSQSNCNVVGGISKLFKYFISKYNPSSIISYSNTAHHKGLIYNLLGFNLVSITKPNYYTYNHYKIYDCGNKVWLYSKNNKTNI